MLEHVVVSLYVLALRWTVNLFGVYPTSCALSVGIPSCDSELDKWLREWMDGYLCSRFHRQDFPILVVFANDTGYFVFATQEGITSVLSVMSQ